MPRRHRYCRVCKISLTGEGPTVDLCAKHADKLGEERVEREQDTDWEQDQAGQNDFEASMGWGRE